MQQRVIVFLLGLLATGITAYTTTKQHNKIVSCYYSSWAFYRPGYGKFDVEDIDTDLCTHGFYGFADMDNVTWEVYPYDPWFDQAPEDCEPDHCNFDSYRRFVALKERNPNFHPMLSIGGWNAGSGKYSMMAEDPVKRKLFIDSTLVFIKKYGFDGVDLDWEYPGDRDGANATIDKDSFSALVEEFSTVLKPEGLLFTAALGCGYKKIIVAYDMPFISQFFDFMNIMGYDFHGAWENFTGHNSPIYHRDEENYEGHPGYLFNLYDAAEFFLDLGTPAEKMVLGIPTYGRGFQLTDPSQNGLYCDADDGIPMGPYTRQKGILGYLEVQQLFHNDSYPYLPEAVPGQWETVIDDCYMTPYMYNGPYWMSYDDPESISYKVRYANLRGFGGIMVWSIETDDFGGFYPPYTPYPILRRANEELALGMTYDPRKPGCGSAPMCDNFIQSTTTTTTSSSTTTTASTTTTTQGGIGGACSADMQVHPYPGDCHRYYRCFSDGNGGYTTVTYSCGDFVFNPNALECVDPNEQGNENICG